MSPRITRLRPIPIGFAHRGASATAPENTLPAFALALELGATGLESDVWVTSDGVAVLDHDGLAGRQGLRRPAIASVARADLPSHIPSVSELFAHCDTQFELSLDVKDPAAIQPLMDAVALADPDGSLGCMSRLWLCHPNVDLLQSWGERWPRARLVHSERLPRLTQSPEQHGAQLAEAGLHAMNMHYSDWSAGLVTLFHRFGLHAFGWDAQHPRVLAQLLDIGIDAVYSDHTAKMMAAIGEA